MGRGEGRGEWKRHPLAFLPALPSLISGFLGLLCSGRGCSTKLHLSNVNKNTWRLSTAFLAPPSARLWKLHVGLISPGGGGV